MEPRLVSWVIMAILVTAIRVMATPVMAIRTMVTGITVTRRTAITARDTITAVTRRSLCTRPWSSRTPRTGTGITVATVTTTVE